MEQSNIRINRRNEAAKYGIVFGLISAAYLFIGHLQISSGTVSTFSSFIGITIWMAKFVGCIILMKYVMHKFVSANPGATKSDLFKLGALIAMFSALIYSVITVADQIYIIPEYYQGLYDVALEEYSKVLNEDQMREIKSMLTNAPKISFFITFLYCVIYGTVLSLILSQTVPTGNQINNEQ